MNVENAVYRKGLLNGSMATMSVALSFIALLMWGDPFSAKRVTRVQEDSASILNDLRVMLERYRGVKGTLPTSIDELLAIDYVNQADKASATRIRTAVADGSVPFALVQGVPELESVCPARLIIVAYMKEPSSYGECEALDGELHRIRRRCGEIDDRLELLRILHQLAMKQKRMVENSARDGK